MFRKPDDPRRYIHRTSPTGKSPVVQSGIQNSNVQHLMDGLAKNRPLPVGTREPRFGDFTLDSFSDLQTAMNQVLDAKRTFGALPSKVRDLFDHDPANLGRALDDPNPKVQQALVKLGFKQAPEEPKSTESPVTMAQVLDALKGLRTDFEANPRKGSQQYAHLLP